MVQSARLPASLGAAFGKQLVDRRFLFGRAPFRCRFNIGQHLGQISAGERMHGYQDADRRRAILDRDSVGQCSDRAGRQFLQIAHADGRCHWPLLLLYWYVKLHYNLDRGNAAMACVSQHGHGEPIMSTHFPKSTGGSIKEARLIAVAR